MNGDVLVSRLLARGFRLFSGVPCSCLGPLIQAAEDSGEVIYVNAANEGEAVAICSGAELGGVGAVAMFQNSGLGNAINPLTSLNAVARIPVLMLISWRGQPGRVADEPQHAVMGQVLQELLDTIGVPHAILPKEEPECARVLDLSVESMATSGRPFALIVERGTIEGASAAPGVPARLPVAYGSSSFSADPLDADDVLRAIADGASACNAAVFATTGFTGRALYKIADRCNQFYMAGAMGCASSLGLGLALARADHRVVVVDGDGAFMMRMGAAAAVAAARPSNLTHVVFDNGVHESTGGQATLAVNCSIPGVALACNYPRVDMANSVDEVRRLIEMPSDGLRFVYVRTKAAPGRKLPRPSCGPDVVAKRFRSWLDEG